MGAKSIGFARVDAVLHDDDLQWITRRRARGANRRRSPAPLRTKLVFPLIDALPLDPFTRHRIYLFLNRPRQTVSFRRLRRAA